MGERKRIETDEQSSIVARTGYRDQNCASEIEIPEADKMLENSTCTKGGTATHFGNPFEKCI